MTNLGQKFEKVLEKIESLDSKKVDIIKKPKDIYFSDGKLKVEGLGNIDFTKTGLQTFFAKLDLPSSYMKRLLEIEGKNPIEIERDREVFRINIERGIETLKEDTNLFLRTFNEGDRHIVRGVFSDRYKVIDNYPILEQIGKYDHSKIVTEHFFVDSDYMDIRFIMPDLKQSIGRLPEHEIRFGVEEDIVYPAIHIRNSEVGRSKISVQFIVYRLVCTNGLINVRDQYQVVNKRHIGDFDLSEITTQMATIVDRAPILFEEYINTVADSKKKIINNIPEIIKSFNRRTEITKKMTVVIYNNWESEQRREETKFGLVNALTAGARDWERLTGDFSGRLRIEELAGETLFNNLV